MIRTLLKKSLRESRWLLAGCSLILFAFCWLRVWMVGRLDTSRFKAIIDLLPGDWKKFSPVEMEWLVTYAGRISLAFDEPIVVFTVSIWAIARGSDCVSGELNRGTMEMLLAQPVSRRQVLLTQSTVNLFGVALLAFIAWFGTYVGVQTVSAKEEVRPSLSLPFALPLFGRDISVPLGEPTTQYTPMREKVDAEVFVPAAVNLCSLGIFWVGLTTLLSSCDRYRWRTIGGAVGFYVVQLGLKIIGMAATEWSWLRKLSVFTAYEPEAFVSVALAAPELTWALKLSEPNRALGSIGPLGYDLIMIGLGVVSIVVATVIFHRRDLPAPL